MSAMCCNVCIEITMATTSSEIYSVVAMSVMCCNVCNEVVKRPRNDTQIITPNYYFVSLETTYN
jgi:hypothetical protein